MLQSRHDVHPEVDPLDALLIRGDGLDRLAEAVLVGDVGDVDAGVDGQRGLGTRP